ncbi:uncharacterized protein BDCG_00040 [Blastomyces dermatitidis ER-3]|uniref:Uncharacterized protein n=1 Tax=Ajellomyces dermatitidis (strain ER-3 / ATCC MYA-2586) TaxID=559297 RepID=A0ABP2EJP1_AJEDR|nr:uncharacterized protein BDCG_00040 [Blastomyces dermatitidis ER-3]EEQ83235.2 hypothetical protein BDCG_00040 [Blastomyces dermatitidis ER-3]
MLALFDFRDTLQCNRRCSSLRAGQFYPFGLGNNSSMTTGNRIDVVEDTFQNVVGIAGSLQPEEISLQFLNSSGCFEGLSSKPSLFGMAVTADCQVVDFQAFQGWKLVEFHSIVRTPALEAVFQTPSLRFGIAVPKVNRGSFQSPT